MIPVTILRKTTRLAISLAPRGRVNSVNCSARSRVFQSSSRRPLIKTFPLISRTSPRRRLTRNDRENKENDAKRLDGNREKGRRRGRGGGRKKESGNRGKRSNSSRRYRMKGLNKRNPCFRSVSENPATVASSFTRSTRTFSSTKKVSTIPKEHCKMPFPFLPLSLSFPSLSLSHSPMGLLVSGYTRPFGRLFSSLAVVVVLGSPERPPNSRCFARSITISRWPGEIHSLIRMPIGN